MTCALTLLRSALAGRLGAVLVTVFKKPSEKPEDAKFPEK
jgi:hypothetical protein